MVEIYFHRRSKFGKNIKIVRFFSPGYVYLVLKCFPCNTLRYLLKRKIMHIIFCTSDQNCMSIKLEKKCYSG